MKSQKKSIQSQDVIFEIKLHIYLKNNLYIINIVLKKISKILKLMYIKKTTIKGYYHTK